MVSMNIELSMRESTYWVEAAIGIDNTNYWSRQRILTVPKSFDENFPQEQRKVSISIRCQSLAETAG